MNAETLLRDMEQAVDLLNQDKANLIRHTIQKLCPDVTQETLDTVTADTRLVVPSQIIPTEHGPLPDWITVSGIVTDSIYVLPDTPLSHTLLPMRVTHHE